MGGGREATASLLPYLPRLAVEWAVHSPGERVRSVDGSLVFVDISGFTALSERLASRGRIGAEELTDVLSTCFADLLAIAYAEGGGLLKFGGDALLVLFEGDGHARRAAEAAIDMRRALRSVGRLKTTVGNVQLRMSVGIHSGTLHLFQVGESHKELVITGPGASATVDMESTAEAGEVLVSRATAEQLDPRLVGEPKGNGLLLRDRRNGGTDAAEAAPWPLDPGDALIDSIPVALRPHLHDGAAESEHRHAIVAFVHFDDVDHLMETQGAAATAAALHELVGDTQAAVDREGVTFLGTDIDRDGGKIILVAGAPTAHGDDEGRMLRALRRIADGQRVLPVRIGVNRGHVFVGEVGPRYRRTFTVMGDAVNLAARLMARAQPGQILATAEVLERSRTAFETEALEPFMVKGKSQPVQAWAVGAATGAKANRRSEGLPFTGRDKELAYLLDALASVESGSGRLVEVVGDAGVGKSRLVSELLAARREVLALRAACEPYEVTTPYYMAAQVLRPILGIDTGGTRGGRRLHRRVQSVAPELLPWVPLIADATGVEVAPTPEADAIEPSYRAQRTAQVVAELLGRMLTFTAMLAVEDAQWMDGASAELLSGIAAQLEQRPWFLVVTRRDEPAGFHAPAGSPTVSQVVLEPLDDEPAAALVNAATDDDPLLPHERDQLVRRAGGNPLYLEELLRARGRGESAMSDSLEALVAAQIDRLPPAERRLLRQAAVLGFAFEPAVLAEVAELPRSSAAKVVAALDGFVQADRRARRVHFRSRVVHEVAYETLPFRTRRALHGRAGEVMERSAGEAATEQAEILSFHFMHAGDHERCWRYARLAADRAKAKYANVEAVELYERALGAARHLPGVPEHERAELWEALGDVSLNAGLVPRTKSAYREARRLRENDPVALATLCRKEAMAAERHSQSSSSVRWIHRGLRALEHLDGRVERSTRADLLAVLGWFRHRQGRHRDALATGTLALADAQATGNQLAELSAHQLLDLVHIDMGEPDQAVNGHRALALAEAVGDNRAQALIHIILGSLAYYRGRWQEALELYTTGRDINERIGNVVDSGFGTCNIAEILIDQGRYDEARSALDEVERTFRSVGFPPGMGFVTYQRGRLAVRMGDHDAAEAAFSRAQQVFDAYGMAAQLREIDAWRAESRLRRGDVDTAILMLEESIRRERSGNVTAALPMLHRLRGYAHAVAGRLVDAWTDLDTSLRLARARGAVYDVALTLEALSILAELGGQAVDEAIHAEYRQLLDELGVRRTAPPLVGTPSA